MEALYGDLENYNEVNIVEELRNENRDLKLKLEEYETAIGKLQKDYDKLVLEFNNLQTNYSSLLKTARAEVERKAQMITQLNIEKDTMILKTLQNANNRRFQNRLQSNTQIQKKMTSTKTDKASVNKKTKPEHNVNNESLNRSELKENVAVQSAKTHDNNMAIRRKSLPSPTLHLINKDQELDETRNQKIKDTLPKEICKTSNTNERFKIMTNEGVIKTTSDTVSMSDRSSNSLELNRDGSRSALNKHIECEQFKKDKIRESDRFTKKIDEYREGDKNRERHSNRKNDKMLFIRQTEEGDKYSDGNKFQEGDKCREDYKCRDKNRDGDREDEKFGENESLREGEKLNEQEKCGENENTNRHSNKYRMGDNCWQSDRYRESEKYRESDRHREGESYREGGRPRESDRYRETDRSRESDRYRETDRSGESDRYRETDRSGESDRYREGDRSRESDRFREADRSRESDRYREIDRSRESDWHRDSNRYRMIDKRKESDKYKEDDKYFHTGKFRNRDKFDPPHRYKRHYSPDRFYKRNYRECQDDYKQNYGRYRVLGSCTPESHSFSHTRSNEIFSKGQNLQSENHKHLHESTHAEGLSLFDNLDEPCKKRQKFEYEINVDEYRQHHDREPLIRPSFSMNFDIPATSCQSPDAVFSPDSCTDTQTAHIVKEIRNTSTAPLEDPRLISKRYVLKTESGKTTLSLAASQYIDIKPVDKSLWNIQSVAMPEALLKEPDSNIAEECIKEIYMDVDNPESNVSIEKGEIVDDTISPSDVQENDLEKRLEVNDTHEVAVKFDVISTLKTNSENIQKITTLSEIPDEIQLNKQPDIPKDLPKIICDDNFTKKIIKDNQHSAILQSCLPQFDDLETSAPHKHMSKNKRDRHNQISSSELAMVQDDLELSDETSDNVDYHKHIVTEKEILCQEQSTLVAKKDNDINNESKYSLKITPEVSVEIVNSTPNDSLKDCDGHKKQKSKKRTTKSKEKESNEKNNDIHVTEKKIKSKKDKEVKPQEIKNKFSDLFGDSSSLITPADLGIPSECVPLCEDDQDAVDINIKEVGATQSCANDLILNETIPEKARHCDTDINNKETAASIEGYNASSNEDANNIYQNVNAEVDLNKPDIVKTVIISSGVQPQFMLENKEETTQNHVEKDVNKQNNVNFHQVAVDAEFKKQASLKALATSTPHKELFINVIGPECINMLGDSVSGCIDTNSPVVNQSNINSQESLDAPDVRIFVRRRKKGVKKP